MISPFRQKGKLEKKTTGLHFDCLFPVKRYGATMQLALKNARHSLHMSRDSTHARDTTPQVHLNSQTRQTTSYFTKVRTTNDPYRKTILHQFHKRSITPQKSRADQYLPESTGISHAHTEKKPLEIEQRMQSTNHTYSATSTKGVQLKPLKLLSSLVIKLG